MLRGEDHICGADVSAGGHAAAAVSSLVTYVYYHLPSTALLSILFPMFTSPSLI